MALEDFEIDKNGVLIKYHGFNADIVIPDSITSIGERAFEGCKSLKSVIIPDSVTVIGQFAFSSCSFLQFATISHRITKIEDCTFAYCKSLMSITIPNSVITIGTSAFYGCESLTSITIPNSVTALGDLSFAYCKSLTSITIPNSVTSIGGWLFEYCESLPSITIPDSVASFGNGIFLDCSSLVYLKVPKFFGNSFSTVEGIELALRSKSRPAIWCDFPIDGLSSKIVKACHAYGFAKASAKGIEISEDLAYSYREYISRHLKFLISTIGDKFYDDTETLAWIAGEGLIPKRMITTLTTELSKRGHVEAAAVVLETINGQSGAVKKSKGLEL